MKVTITANGTLSIMPDSETEEYALIKWLNDPHKVVEMEIPGESDGMHRWTTSNDRIVDAIHNAAQHMKSGGADYLTFAEKVFEIVGIDYER